MLKLYTLVATLILLYTTPILADVKVSPTYDLGIQFASSITPELGYSQMKIKCGFDVGVSLFQIESNLMSRVANPNTTKLLRLGVGQVDNKLILTFAPVSAPIYNKLYLTPSIGLGKKPYTLWGLTYTIVD